MFRRNFSRNKVAIISLTAIGITTLGCGYRYMNMSDIHKDKSVLLKMYYNGDPDHWTWSLILPPPICVNALPRTEPWTIDEEKLLCDGCKKDIVLR